MKFITSSFLGQRELLTRSLEESGRNPIGEIRVRRWHPGNQSMERSALQLMPGASITGRLYALLRVLPCANRSTKSTVLSRASEAGLVPKILCAVTARWDDDAKSRIRAMSRMS